MKDAKKILEKERRVNNISIMQVSLDRGKGKDDVLCQLINSEVNRMRHNTQKALKKVECDRN